MSRGDPHLDLTRPLQGGVYDVPAADYAGIARQARQAELALCRIDLAGCTGKPALLRRMASALLWPFTLPFSTLPALGANGAGQRMLAPGST